MPFIEIFIATFVYAWHYKLDLYKATIVPIICSLTLELTLSYTKLGQQSLLNNDQTESSLATILIIIIASFLSTALYVIIAVRTHQTVLLDNSNEKSIKGLSWSYKELKFFLVTSIFYIPFYLFIFVKNNTFAGIFSLLFLAYMIYVLLFSLIFPAIAIDHKMSLDQAWKLGKKHFSKLLKSCFFFPISLSIISAPLLLIPNSEIVIGPIILILSIIALSLTFKKVISIEKI